jgi:hypothetical protein
MYSLILSAFLVQTLSQFTLWCNEIFYMNTPHINLYIFPKATRDLEPISYREILLNTLLHVTIYVFTQFT